MAGNTLATGHHYACEWLETPAPDHWPCSERGIELFTFLPSPSPSDRQNALSPLDALCIPEPTHRWLLLLLLGRRRLGRGGRHVWSQALPLSATAFVPRSSTLSPRCAALTSRRRNARQRCQAAPILAPCLGIIQGRSGRARYQIQGPKSERGLEALSCQRHIV